MINSLTDCTVLHNNVKMPWLGFGVFQMGVGLETEKSVRVALETGYRSIDTATIYENEADVGKAITESGIPREEIFVTTKVWNTDMVYDSTFKSFDESRKRLRLDVIDLYLVHWPATGIYIETWRALEKLYKDGVVRAIGVSNFKVHNLEKILPNCEVKPMLNQVEYHPLLQQTDVHKYCRDNKIQLEAWAPLYQGKALTIPTIVEIGEKYGKTPAQILIRWDLQNEVVTIPKSITPKRIIENSQVFDFQISQEDMVRIDRLNEERSDIEYPEDIDH